MSKIVTFIIAGIGLFLILSIVGGVIVFNNFIKPNLATVTQPVAEISQPIVSEGEKIVQEGLEQGQQEASNIVLEIIQANITAVREQIISTFTIGGGEESE
ncbi:hypothetical protein EBU71_12385 [bacterium]|nr:hypothetical protein [Candidatus Elulimicrobium humile]